MAARVSTGEPGGLTITKGGRATSHMPSSLLLAVVLTILSAGCTTYRQREIRTAEPSADLQALVRCMAGSFSSAEQAAADTSYFDIRLRMAPIWAERRDGYWLYVEQAVAGHEERPYRQRIYQVIQIDKVSFESRVYTLKAPVRFAGSWKEENPLRTLTPDSLILRSGCSIYLREMRGPVFAGSTRGKGCASELRGAIYATSDVEITPAGLTSWDRGFDDEGAQVWGATKGGYVFRKIEDWSGRIR